MKYIISIYLFALSFCSLAQQIGGEWSNDEKRVFINMLDNTVKDCPIIIEGTNIYEETYFEPKDSMLRIIYYIEIKRIYKGSDLLNNQRGRIQIVKREKYAPLDAKDSLKFLKEYLVGRFTKGQPTTNIYLLEPSKFYVRPSKRMQLENSNSLQLYKNDATKIFIGSSENFKGEAGFSWNNYTGISFYKYSDWLNYISLKLEKPIPMRDDSLYIARKNNNFPLNEYGIDQQKSRLKSDNPSREKIEMDSLNNILDSYIERMGKKVKKQTGLHTKKRGDRTVTYSIENFKTSITKNTAWTEFDVFIISSDPSIYYRLISTQIVLDSAYNVPSNSNINSYFTVGTGFSNYRLIYSIPSDNHITINLWGAYMDGKLLIKASSKMLMIHCKFPLSKIKAQTSIGLQNSNASGVIKSVYCSSNAPALDEPFDFYNYEQYTPLLNSTIGSKPVIKSFNKTTFKAGVLDVLEIKGTGFGNERGDSSKVMLRNANKDITDKDSYFKIDSLDFKTEINDLECWRDTLIRLYISSVSNSNVLFCAASGKVKVATMFGETISLDSIHVNGAYVNIYDPSNKKKYLRYVTNSGSTNGGIRIRIDNTIRSHSDALKISKAIRQALKDWNAALGECFFSLDTISTSTTSNSFALFDTIGTTLQVTNAINRVSDSKAYINSFCIRFNTNYSWDYSLPGNPIPAGYHDFYSCLLHELGHVLSLQHIVPKSQLMYYTQTSNYLGINQRIVLNKENDASVQNAKYIIDKSKGIVWSNANLHLTNYNISSLIAPSDFKTTEIGNSFVKLSWKDRSISEDGFYLTKFNGGVLDTILLQPNTESYQYNNLTPNTPYSISLSTFNICEQTYWHDLDVATFSYIDPPSNLYDFPSQPDRLYISWTGDATAQYQISRSANGSAYTVIGTAAAGTFAYEDTGLQANTAYTYQIVALKPGAISDVQQITLTTGNLSLCSSNATVKLQNMQTIPTQLYATQTIQAGASVDNTRATGDVGVNNAGNVTLEAGQNVSFEPGFTVEASTNRSLVAQIKDCSTGVVAFKASEIIDSIAPISIATQTTNILQPEAKQDLVWAVYPNPTSNNLTISCSIPIEHIEVSSSMGQIFLNYAQESTNAIVDMSTLSAGVYILRITTNQSVLQQTIVKQ